jgi:1-acyl-sn-glycerol-3-phosphate acyltransferase
MVELVIVAALGLWLLVRWRRSGQTLFNFTCLPISRLYSQLWHGWWCRGTAPLPPTGPAILVSNHTCSADPMFLQAALTRIPCYLTSREHYEGSPFIRTMCDKLDCVPVVRDGRDPGAVLRSLRRLEQGRLLVIFPEGNLSGVARNRLRAGKHGAALLALRTRAPVFPAYIAGGPRTEKLLLSWIWPPPGRVSVRFGPAVDLSAYYDRPRTRQVLEEVTALLLQHINALQSPRKERNP